jgi:DNA-binding HxlR family transcriptional regulator
MDVRRLLFDPASCSVAAALSVVGDKWTLLVMREAFYGVRRYDDMLATVGCARNILSDRLRKLVEHGLLQRVPYQEEGRRERAEYRLTAMGMELFPVLIALMQWGDRWVTPAGGPSVVLEHRDCGAPVHAELRCSDGHGPLSASETVAVPASER